MLVVKVVTVGTFTVDIVASELPKIAEPGEIVNVDAPIDLYVGGHAANVAVDLVKLGFANGVSALGAVGDDVFAKIIKEELSKFGVIFKPQVIKGVGTARNAILVVKGEDRRFHIYPGANRFLTSEFIVNSIKELRPSYVYIALGFSRSLDSGIREVIEEAKSLRSFILLDIARINELSRSAVLNVMSDVDVLHLNMIEIRALTGRTELIDCIKSLKGRYPKLLTVTLGGEGVVAVFQGRYLLKQPPFKVEPKDPTGAGDAFCAGLLNYVANRGCSSCSIGELSTEDIKELLMSAQAAGASATLAPGATTSVSYDTVRMLIESQGKSLMASTAVALIY